MDLGASIRKLALGALAVASFLAGGSASAQVVTGTLGQASATTRAMASPAPSEASSRRRTWIDKLTFSLGPSQLTAEDNKKAAEAIATAKD